MQQLVSYDNNNMLLTIIVVVHYYIHSKGTIPSHKLFNAQHTLTIESKSVPL